MATVGLPKQLNSGAGTDTQAGTTATTLYTVPASTTAVVQTVTLCNTSASAITISLYRVPSGGTAGVANQVINSYSLAANETRFLDELRWGLSAGTMIQASAQIANVVTIFLDGVEVAN
jgi:hypothetical protein